MWVWAWAVSVSGGCVTGSVGTSVGTSVGVGVGVGVSVGVNRGRGRRCFHLKHEGLLHRRGPPPAVEARVHDGGDVISHCPFSNCRGPPDDTAGSSIEGESRGQI